MTGNQIMLYDTRANQQLNGRITWTDYYENGYVLQELLNHQHQHPMKKKFAEQHLTISEVFDFDTIDVSRFKIYWIY